MRAAYHQAIHSPDLHSRLDLNAVLSYGGTSGLRATADLGAKIFFPFRSSNPAPPPVQLTYAVGLSSPFTPELRAGLEVFGEVLAGSSPFPTDLPHHFVGASIGCERRPGSESV